MPGWDTETRRQSRKVLEQVVLLGTPATNWWAYSDVVGRRLKVTPNELYDAVQLLIKEGDVESNTKDCYAMRATLRGWVKAQGVWDSP